MRLKVMSSEMDLAKCGLIRKVLIKFPIANFCTRWCGNLSLKGLSQDGGRADPGWVKNQVPDPGWTYRIIFPRAWKQFLGLQIPKLLDADPNPNPGSGIFLTLDPGWKNSDTGSGINIRDPQNWLNESLIQYLKTMVKIRIWIQNVREPFRIENK
jgi:hypothetical protein